MVSTWGRLLGSGTSASRASDSDSTPASFCHGSLIHASTGADGLQPKPRPLFFVLVQQWSAASRSSRKYVAQLWFKRVELGIEPHPVLQFVQVDLVLKLDAGFRDRHHGRLTQAEAKPFGNAAFGASRMLCSAKTMASCQFSNLLFTSMVIVAR